MHFFYIVLNRTLYLYRVRGTKCGHPAGKLGDYIIYRGVPRMGPRVPFAPARVDLRIIVSRATAVCFLYFWKSNPIKLFEKKKKGPSFPPDFFQNSSV